MHRLRWTFLGFVCVGATFAALPAEAQFTVCNQSPKAARVALGYWDNVDYVTEGWWTVLPGGCTVTHPERLIRQWYYIYGETDADSSGSYDVWSGATPLCVSRPESFKIVGKADCDTRFIEIDTGLSKEWTFTLE
jgi:uncharacterized membrane protein